MANIPGKVESQRQFTTLPTADRRAIIRAVNKGQPVANRKHAHMAVWIARRQIGFWRWAWLIGPVIGVAQFFTGLTPEQVLVNAGGATAFLLLLSSFWIRRARRSEAHNLELADRGRSKRTTAVATPDKPKGRGLLDRFRRTPKTSTANPASNTPSTSGSRGHLPGEAPSSRTATASGSAPKTGDAAPTPPGQRPYKPRGRKRR